MSAPPEGVQVHRAADRFRTSTSWLDSAHSFSFGRHYDPSNTSFGVLLASNDDVVAPGSGFDSHPHRDVEVVTWVLRGSLVHQDSEGGSGVVVPGLAQRMSAGRGVLHSERNGAPAGLPEPVHLVQMWVAPDEAGLDPSYEQRPVDLLTGGLVPVASGRPGHDAAVRIRNRHATLHAARLVPGQGVQLPEAPYLHLFVAVGSVELEGVGPLGTGDAARCTATGGQQVTARGPAEVLVWEMHASLAAGARGGGHP